MDTILEINNWDQLVRARSECSNLRIKVSHYKDSTLTGTKISIIDYNTNEIYLVIFANVLEASVIPTTASLQTQQIVDIINSYGFNIRISEPEVVPENVLTILRGCYESGYRYVYRDYKNWHCLGKQVQSKIYVSQMITLRRDDPSITDTPNFVADEWDWCQAFKTYAISDILENGTVDNGITP
jgi:hypothetical protein